MNPPPSKEPAADTGAMIKAAVGAWTGLAAIGSFMLYVAGYLALRFHLTVFGIGAAPHFGQCSRSSSMTRLSSRPHQEL